MIRSFRNKDTRAAYEGNAPKKWGALLKQIEKRLHILDMATSMEDLRHMPSNRFESLAGKRKSQYSIRINKQWRICFEWVNGEPHNVEIVDYH